MSFGCNKYSGLLVRRDYFLSQGLNLVEPFAQERSQFIRIQRGAVGWRRRKSSDRCKSFVVQLRNGAIEIRLTGHRARDDIGDLIETHPATFEIVAKNDPENVFRGGAGYFSHRLVGIHGGWSLSGRYS